MVWFSTLTLALAAVAPPTSPVGYSLVQSGKAYYHTVKVDLSRPDVSASVVSSPKLVSIWRLVSGRQSVAAITGTFFNHSTQRPIADVLIEGNLTARGNRGSLVGVDWFGGVQIRDVPYRKPADWGDFRYGLRGTVRVVTHGKVNPNPKAQRFNDSRIWGRAARTGIGVTKQGKLVLMATRQSVTLSQLGYAMRKAGVVDGVSLDGGGSTALYYKGKLVVPPQRKLNNVFVVSHKPADFPVILTKPTSVSTMAQTAEH